MSRRIEICWSDEPGQWRDYQAVDPKRPVEQQFRELQDDWLATKQKFELRYDMLVRVSP